MPTLVPDIPVPSPPPDPPRKRWTRAECEAFDAQGLLDYERLELIDGDLIQKMPKKPRHSIVLALLYEWLAGIFGMRLVNQERTIDVSPEDNPTNLPEPDLIVRTRAVSSYPKPADLQLVVEVADTTLRFDLSTKAALYARAGIREYWVVDLLDRRIVVDRDPAEGRYRSIAAYSEDETISPLAQPDRTLKIREIFSEPAA